MKTIDEVEFSKLRYEQASEDWRQQNSSRKLLERSEPLYAITPF